MRNDVAGPEASKRHAGAVPDFVYFFIAGIVIIFGLLWLEHRAHGHAPKLRAECEARGGMLLSTRDTLYACVGKPPEPAASR